MNSFFPLIMFMVSCKYHLIFTYPILKITTKDTIMLGPQNVLHKYEPFLLNKPICMLLYCLSCIIVTMSSCVLYMYGYQKFMAFISLERDKNNIVLREGRTSLWSYFSHCSAMCVLIALAGMYLHK